VTQLSDDHDQVPAYKRGYACVDGEFMPAADATVSIFDHSFLYGDGVFESIACRKGRPFALQPHLERLDASCRYLELEHPYTAEQLIEMVHELIARNGAGSGYIRIVVSRGEGYPVSDPRKAIRPTVVISMQGEPAVQRDPAEGIRLAIASTRRIPPICLEPRVKSNNYLNHIVAKLEAVAAGADDAILLDIDGNVAELPVSNVFTRHGNMLSTPPSRAILAGITRETVFGLIDSGAAGMELIVEERQMSPYDLFTADEVFVVGTGTGVAFVKSIDGRLINGGVMGPVAANLLDAYEELLDNGLEPPHRRTVAAVNHEPASQA
jgi:branched-chain amino acid aminotransferase